MNNKHPLSFPKAERLCSHNVINDLFSNGKAFVSYPFRVLFYETELPKEVDSQILFTVSKKKFKRAVHRNLIKRRSKEAYRLNKAPLTQFLENHPQQIAIAVVYIASESLSYSKIEKGMVKTIQKLITELSTEPNAE